MITADTARRYVELVLAVGVHAPTYVDAYYGPPAWRTEVEARRPPLAEIRAGAEELLARVSAQPQAGDDLDARRTRFVVAHLEALIARVDMLGGRRLSFDEESRVLYGAVAPRVPEARFEEVLARIDRIVPGPKPLRDRVEALRRTVTIPPDRLDAVFTAAIRECRERTRGHLALPAGESFTVEYVRDRPWSAYNWYQGGYRSIIQVNTDLPIYIDRAIDLACHEGYPGHHVYNLLIEHDLVRGRGASELSIYPLNSPMSLIAEGSANYGIDVAFPGDERVELEQRVLYPLAGLDPSLAAAHAQLVELQAELKHAQNQAARRYLDGEIDAAAAAAYLVEYDLASPDRAAKRVAFIDAYRAYVINYNVGEELVRAYVERAAAGDQARRWEAFRRILALPTLPAELQR
jgi:hypothetical protein